VSSHFVYLNFCYERKDSGADLPVPITSLLPILSKSFGAPALATNPPAETRSFRRPISSNSRRSTPQFTSTFATLLRTTSSGRLSTRKRGVFAAARRRGAAPRAAQTKTARLRPAHPRRLPPVVRHENLLDATRPKEKSSSPIPPKARATIAAARWTSRFTT